MIYEKSSTAKKIAAAQVGARGEAYKLQKEGLLLFNTSTTV
jgi:hypothetical protein